MNTVQTDTAALADDRATNSFDAARYQARVLQLLDAHVAQRGGLEPGNYGSWADYRAESRSVTRDRHHYNALRGAVRWRTFTREQWADAFRAFSGRLTLQHGADGMPARLDYCTGQYFPTEYRRAACAVLASLLWSDARDNMPAPTLHHNSETGETVERYNGKRAGDWLRNKFAREFGRTIAQRWFA